MNVAILIVSTASLIASCATLVIVLVGGKRAETKISEVENKARTGLAAVKNAVAEIEL